MDIPLVSTSPTGAIGIIAPIPAVVLTSVESSQALLGLPAQTTVDLSPLGRFLSAVTLFQKRILALQTNQAAVATEPDTPEADTAIASSALALSDSATALQASLISGTSDDQSLGTLLSQQFDAQHASTGDSDSLAAIGLRFASDPGQADVISVDTAVLQAAFQTDPAGTAALLGRTAAAFGTLAGMATKAEPDPTVLGAQADSETAAPAAPHSAGAYALPEVADSTPVLSNDGAFLQELLADAAKPSLAFSQAPPPALAEANANFAAKRAAAASSPNGLVSTAGIEDTADLPTAASAAAGSIAADKAVPEAMVELDNQAVTLQPSDKPDAADHRMIDNIVAERDASARINNAITAGRVAQAAERETHAIDTKSRAQAADKTREERILDATGIQAQLPIAAQASQAATEARQPAAPPPLAAAPSTAHALPTTGQTEPIAPPAQQIVNNAPQLARDPAIAAAIAAYNLNAGPFAALNGRPELAAPRTKAIAAVASVASVKAIDTDAATNESGPAPR